ncbi:MAG: hypothetical protein C0502_00720 [Opitutus sp.]|nr:hypothetical protein [Opitutus sp.]
MIRASRLAVISAAMGRPGFSPISAEPPEHSAAAPPPCSPLFSPPLPEMHPEHLSRLGLLFALGALAPVAAAMPSAPDLLKSPRPLVIAHRGYSGAAPENTLPSFSAALLAGADLVELDYRPTRDGALVVIHDATADRTTDARTRWGGARHRVADRTLAELRTLDAGRWFDARFAGAVLPDLGEALDLIAPAALPLIEHKAGDARTCVEFLRGRRLLNRVVVQSYDWSYLRDFHALAPEQVLGALGPVEHGDGLPPTGPDKLLGPAQLERLAAAGASIAVWNHANLGPDSVRAAHARGLRVWVYTVDDVATALRLLDLGVDGIITNHPPLLWKALALRAAR